MNNLYLFSGGEQNVIGKTRSEIPTGDRRFVVAKNPQKSLEILPLGETQPGAMQEPSDAKGLQHQREDKPDGDTASPTYAPLLEGKRIFEKIKELEPDCSSSKSSSWQLKILMLPAKYNGTVS